jgi:hypothetical protein
MAAQIVAGAAILPATRASIAKWDDKDAIAIQVINNCLDNNTISNVQSKITSQMLGKN